MNSPASGTTQNSPQLSYRETELIRIQADAEIELRRRLGTSLKGFVSETKPDYQWYRHCNKLANVLDQVEQGKIKRLMIWMPPQNGKSELTSRQFPAYALFNHPDRKIISTSYAADLAFLLSRDARDNYLKTGRPLRDDASAVHNWLTPQGGGMLSAGVGGPITGSGGDILIIDDPIKNAEEAYSQTVQENQWNWWRTVFYTRRRPNAAIIIIMTRWVDDDLCGRLLRSEKEAPQNWHIVCFPAMSVRLPVFPSSCTVEKDWRDPEEPLCPERYNLKDLTLTRQTVGERAWQAMYQQNPIEDKGNLWKLDWFTKFDDGTFAAQNGRSVTLSNDGCDWDLAYGDEKNEENAASAFVRASVGNDGNIYVTDAGFQWFEFPKQIDWMKGIVSPHYVEAKASGKSAVQMLGKAGVYASEVKVRGGDKVARTIIATPIAEQGKVFIHRKIWDMLLFDERQGILGFPARPFKDLNDAFVQMLNRLWPFTLPPEKQDPMYASSHERMIGEVMNKISNVPRRNRNL